MKKKLFVLGSSLLGLAMCAAVAAEAADEPAAEAPASNAAAIAASDKAAAAPEDTSAKPRGFYVGGSVGGSFFDGASKGSKIFNPGTPDSDFDGKPEHAFTTDKINDESNFMWSVFVGYRLADWLGAEVGWTDIGGFRATDSTDPSDPTDPPHNNHAKTHVDGVEARLRAWVPLGTEYVSGIGGVGIFIFSQHSAKVCDGPDTSECDKAPAPSNQQPSAFDPREDSGQAFTISAGLQFKITDNIHLRTEYQHFFNVLDQGVDMVTANIVVGFYDLFGQGSAGGDSFGGIAVE